jgi:hypothetical protein
MREERPSLPGIYHSARVYRPPSGGSEAHSTYTKPCLARVVVCLADVVLSSTCCWLIYFIRGSYKDCYDDNVLTASLTHTDGRGKKKRQGEVVIKRGGGQIDLPSRAE